MQASTISIANLLTSRERFVAPLYQRPYVWEREKNWEPFWETVRDVSEHHVRGEALRARFLGAIVLEQVSVPVGQVTVRQIIDGQQRLTTLQIMLAAARDVYAARCLERTWPNQFGPQFQQLTGHYPPFRIPEEEFKVWPTNSARHPFMQAMKCGSPVALAVAFGAPQAWQEGPARSPRTVELGHSDDSVVQRVLDLYDGWNEEERDTQWRLLSPKQIAEIRTQFQKFQGDKMPRIVQAYWYFWSSLAEWFDVGLAIMTASDENHTSVDDPDIQQIFNSRVQAFLSAVQQSLVLVAINLDTGEDPQMIFETMNARGLPLTPADLVKNFLFRAAAAQNEALDILYETYWKEFDEDTWWRENVRLGRLTRSRMDAFLWNYLTLSTRREVVAADLFAAYRDWSPVSGLSPAQQIERFALYSRTFRNFEGPQQPERIRLFMHRLGALDVSTIYPLLLELFQRHKHALTDLETILVDLESYLVRRLIVGLTTKNYNRVFFDLLQDLEKKSDFSPPRCTDRWLLSPVKRASGRLMDR